MTILITGIAGFIGSRFARWVRENHPDVKIIGIDDLSGGFIENVPEGVEFIECDDMYVALHYHVGKHRDIDFLYHFAAYASEGRSNHIREFINENNTLTTLEVINFCVNQNIKLVFTSSVAVYSGSPPFNESTPPCPIDEYGLSKFCSEQSIRIAGKTQGLKWTIVRPRNVYGSGQNLFDPSRNLFGILCFNALNNRPIKIFGDGSNERSFTHINDILEPLWRAKDYDGEIFNLGSKYVYTVADAVDAFCKVADYWKVENMEARHEVPSAYCDTKKSESMLGYRDKTSLEDGIKEMWEWAKTQKMRPLMEPPRLEVSINAHPSLL